MSYMELLSTEDLDAIHQTSMRVLERVGVAFPQAEALAIFRQHGARVEGGRVYLTEAQVMAALAVPRHFTLHARNPQRNVAIGDGSLVFAPAYGAPFWWTSKWQASATLDDYQRLAVLSHALPNQDVSGYLLVEPEGVPSAHLHAARTHNHSDKVFMGSTAGRAV
jgi:trimethylamine--corrinoid protein Co-methyltransferase